jgi:lipid A 3-O-deacylase
MKILARVILMLLITGIASMPHATAQQLPSEVMVKKAWDLGLFTGGGVGLGSTSGTRFVFAGGRIGRILTKEHLHGWLRGNFEWAVDLMPLYAVFPPNRAVYGGGFKPAVWQWNFTSGKRIAPYAVVAGAIVFSTANLPPGDTSDVNFAPQVGFGVNYLVRRGQAVRFEAAIVHHSNARLGKLNPGYDASLFFTVGYSWYKTPR